VGMIVCRASNVPARYKAGSVPLALPITKSVPRRSPSPMTTSTRARFDARPHREARNSASVAASRQPMCHFC
jgi:hypothetical protein